MLARILVLALAADAALASLVRRREVPSTHQLHEQHADHWSSAWVKRSKVPAEAVLPMRIGLTQRNLDAGHDLLMDISTPGTDKFRKHMTAEEVADFFAPEPSTVAAVHEWVTSHGIAADRVGLSVNKQWLQFDATADEAESLLYAEFYVWEHAASGTHDISTDAYHVPSHLREHIDYVTPGVRLRSKRSEATASLAKRDHNLGRVQSDNDPLPGFPHPNSTTCSKYVTAECTQHQYGIPAAKTAFKGNELGIFESLDSHYSRKDLDVYFSTLYPHIPNGTYPEERLVDGAIGAVEDSDKFVPIDLESSLDFDAAWPLIYPQGTVLFQEDDEVYESQRGGFAGFWNTFLDAIDGSYCSYSAYGETGDCTEARCLDPVYPHPAPGGYQGQLQCGVYKPTNVISISYGGAELLLPDSYLKRQCNEWMKLALQGVTVVVSAGDNGVGTPQGVCAGNNSDIFVPQFAANCPYVLSVGSTQWDRADNTTTAGPEQPYEKLVEVATTRFPSGGGFSNVFGVPGYQREAVRGYFDQVGETLPFKGYHRFVADGNFSSVTGRGVYHHGGRGYPDVSAVGDRQVVYNNGSWYLIGGTSLSAPVIGAVLTLINEERLAQGKSTLGFIHPIIYQHPEVFNDITVGSNPGCNSTGFPAAKGWDPVSGLGTPNFPKLRKLLCE